ncbi:MAG: exodeoxyribonuclease III, partial [Sulfurihydrogenibium sp.]
YKQRTTMKICTFNVNSIKTRKDLVIEWLKHRNNDIDIICFQEIKTEDKNFPSEDFKELGFVYQEILGQKAYNGVATLSKIPMEKVFFGLNHDYFDNQKRVLATKVLDIFIINTYAPHGDLRGGEKYYYKLDWYKHFISFLKQNFDFENQKVILLGDLNIALEDKDVYDPVLLKDSIGTMPEERELLRELLNLGFIDTFRYLYPDKIQYTWWDYIGGAIWKNEGMRIDYILITKPLIPFLKDVEVDLWPRRRRTPKPSDHAPVIATFENLL